MATHSVPTCKKQTRRLVTKQKRHLSKLNEASSSYHSQDKVSNDGFSNIMPRSLRNRSETQSFLGGKCSLRKLSIGALVLVVLCYCVTFLNVVLSASETEHWPSSVELHDYVHRSGSSAFTGTDNATTECYEDECIEAQAWRLSRSWQPHPHRHWCSLSSSVPVNDSNSTGLWLIKVPKSASSTVAGLALRVAEIHQCAVRWQHAKASDVLSHAHDRNQTFLVAPIRNPRSRALSSVYYHTVSLQFRPSNNGRPADRHILRQLDRVEDDFISEYTRVSLNATKNSWHIVQEIMETYDFLLVVEEMEASLVVFAWLADLSLSDVLVMSSKSSGSWYATGRGRCVPLIPPEVTPAVEHYWKSDGRMRHYTDRLLHAAARHSLHKTIREGMGQELFAEQLKAFRNLQAFTLEKCGAAMNESAPCSPTGVYQPEVAKQACYLRDFGCGHHCLETLFPIPPNQT